MMWQNTHRVGAVALNRPDRRAASRAVEGSRPYLL